MLDNELHSNQAEEITQAIVEGLGFYSNGRGTSYDFPRILITLTVEVDIADGEIDLYIDYYNHVTGHEFSGTKIAKNVEEAITILDRFLIAP